MKRIILLLCLLLLVSSCGFSPSGDSEQEITGCPYSCRSGSSGVELEILNPDTSIGDSEKRIIPAGYEFIPSLIVHDEGMSDADGEVCVTGLDSSTFSGVGGCDCADYYIVVEEEEDYFLNDQVVDIFPGYGVASGTEGDYLMNFINRYKYKTYAVVDACLKQDPADKEGCSSSGSILDVSSSAPLTVKSVDQTITRPGQGTNAINLILTYEVSAKGNAGSGLINDEVLFSGLCYDPNDEDPWIDVKFVILNQEYSCESIQLIAGEGTGSCIADSIITEGSSGEYLFEDQSTHQGYLEFSYLWEDIETVEFRVQ